MMTQLHPFLERLHNLLERDDENYFPTNLELANQLCISERQLFRQLKSITRLSPQKYLQGYRLELARTYLESGKYKRVNEVAFAIGYQNVGYFSRRYAATYGKLPLDVLKENGWR